MSGYPLKSAQTRNIAQYRAHHAAKPHYGRSSVKFLFDIYVLVKFALRDHKGGPFVLLDFGCGKSHVVEDVALLFGDRVEAYRYDPAMPGLTELAVSHADLVINTDVLEHLDEAETDLLIADLAGLSPHCFINISTRAARAVLANGENAHATVKDASWWRAKLGRVWPKLWVRSVTRTALTVTTYRPPLLARMALRTKVYRRFRLRQLQKRVAVLRVNQRA